MNTRRPVGLGMNCVFHSKTASHSNSNPPLIPVKIRHMKQPLHLAVECLMAAKERPVDLADLDGSRSAFVVISASRRIRLLRDS
jgi:hypothetical protein